MKPKYYCLEQRVRDSRKKRNSTRIKSIINNRIKLALRKLYNRHKSRCIASTHSKYSEKCNSGKGNIRVIRTQHRAYLEYREVSWWFERRFHCLIIKIVEYSRELT
jgi:hypothetical protein